MLESSLSLCAVAVCVIVMRCATELVLHRNTEHHRSHRELFVCAHCPWTGMSTKASLELCLACFPFVSSTSFQVPLSAADQSGGPGLRKRERKRLRWEKAGDRHETGRDRQVLCEVNPVQNGARVIDILPDEMAEKQKLSAISHFTSALCMIV